MSKKVVAANEAGSEAQFDPDTGSSPDTGEGGDESGLLGGFSFSPSKKQMMMVAVGVTLLVLAYFLWSNTREQARSRATEDTATTTDDGTLVEASTDEELEDSGVKPANEYDNPGDFDEAVADAIHGQQPHPKDD
ncbi:hypothetical protein DVK00_02865 [Haloarcula sp. Atlit-47R]|uniref:hypothetical protein n=1 Tax=Haloarcula sp. Atlit-47R TaxID=2282132 RepID=UPI000EF19C17|nr:hypothetical protein [Haloarcula sp. Atlit-47R]RLM47466.1 hypothetical protein DVK00_02865 [Haloarcula sp. Atlit-47R]